MLNKEKFVEEIVKIAENGDTLALLDSQKVAIRACQVIDCPACKWANELDCDRARQIWFNEEYVKPKIDVPEGTEIDTPIFVSADGVLWFNAHYAGRARENNKEYILAFVSGKTSWSTWERNRWEYAEVPTAEEIEKMKRGNTKNYLTQKEKEELWI